MVIVCSSGTYSIEAYSSPGKQCTSYPESFLSNKTKRQNSVKQTGEEKRASVKKYGDNCSPRPFHGFVMQYSIWKEKEKIEKARGRGE